METESFDFVIAGGGTAGLVLANRLSEVGHLRILVLEAGLDHSDEPRVKTPGLYSALFGTDIDWGFMTVPQENLDGRNISVNQGKALGGSSVINAQVYIPPTKAILEAWAELGNDGWDWDTIGPYYQKAFTLPQVPEELRRPLGIDNWISDHPSTSGPLALSLAGNPTHPIRELWVETFKRKGYLMEGGPWADASVGAFSILASVDPAKRERVHAAGAYYSPVKHRGNLQVLVGANVNKIIFADGQNRPKAIGLQYTHGGKTKIVNARKEVILAVGALKSPGLLELSGIGNGNILKQYGIETIKDLPGVGENLQDHIVCDIRYDAKDEMGALEDVRRSAGAAEQSMQSSLRSHNGLVSSSGILTYAYLPVVDFLAGEGRKKLIKLIDENRPSVSTESDSVRARAYYDIAEKTLLDPNKPSGAYLTAIGQQSVAPEPGIRLPTPPQIEKHIAIVAILAQPLSRGIVHIVSNDPTKAPEVDPKYLSNPLDMEIFAQHTLYIESIANSAPLSNVLKQPLQRSSPLAHVTDLDAAKRYIKSRAISMWHPAGTCAMLPENAGGVVDASLRVYGVDNLRIVDSSVVPLLPPGNLQSTVYAVAERAADIIKEAHGFT
ncbi:oxidoreductase [Nemania sp. FL0031]|nr:oxidoreductase [Nemania sp. FL0031]